MALDPQYQINVVTPSAGSQVVNQILPGYPLYNAVGGPFVMVQLGKTIAGGSARWAFTIWGASGSPYDPQKRFLQIDPDPSDPIGAYGCDDGNGNPDTNLGEGTVEQWP